MMVETAATSPKAGDLSNVINRRCSGYLICIEDGSMFITADRRLPLWMLQSVGFAGGGEYRIHRQTIDAARWSSLTDGHGILIG